MTNKTKELEDEINKLKEKARKKGWSSGNLIFDFLDGLDTYNYGKLIERKELIEEFEKILNFKIKDGGFFLHGDEVIVIIKENLNKLKEEKK